MRLLLVGDLDQPHVQRWADAMVGAGHRVLVAGFGAGSGFASDVVVERLGGPALRSRRYLPGATRLARLARRWRPAAVHAHFVSSYGLMAGLAMPTTPTLQFAWGSDVLWHDRRNWAQRAAVVRVLRRAAVVVVDADVVSSAVAVLAPATPLVLAVYGPEQSWTVAPRSEESSILSPRQLKPFYNVATIVAAAGRVLPSRPGWHLDVLTGGSDSVGLAIAAEQAGLGPAVTFWPRISRAELQGRFLAAAVCCSVPDSDGTSVALLEAMASGAFPVVSDLPANRAWIDHGVNGLVVPSRDEGALAAALERAVDDEEMRRTAAAINRPLIRERATWERAVETVLAATARAAR